MLMNLNCGFKKYIYIYLCQKVDLKKQKDYVGFLGEGGKNNSDRIFRQPGNSKVAPFNSL